MSIHAEKLIKFINDSPSCFHVIENIKAKLLEAGFSELREGAKWDVVPGGKYFVTKNGSTIFGFSIPECEPSGFMLTAAHSDSPAFKIKDGAEVVSASTTKLSTEKYGGMLMATWFDRPLSIAGRVVTKSENGVCVRLVNINRDIAIIPSVAIHMNRAANDGFKIAANVDTLPIIGGEDVKGSLMKEVANAVGVSEDDILDRDLYLYLRESGRILGVNDEYISAPKLDDLECVYALTEGFVNSANSDAIKVLCIFDNEEVGSETKQGAGSSLLRDALRRLLFALGKNEEDYQMLLASSLLISADNAHATHPNHPEYADLINSPKINGGIVIKYNANQRYTTDAVSAAMFKNICDRVNIPYQAYANRSDLAGGSTLGSISNTMLPIRTVDIGLAQLAMHSSYETAGVSDLDMLITAITEFYSSNTLPEEYI